MLETSMDARLLHRAATAYYLEDMRQADIAERLGISRPAVSKLLAEARRIGMVRFEVLDPEIADTAELAQRVKDALGLASVRVAPGDQSQRRFRGFGPLLADELRSLRLRQGEALLISSGRTTHWVSDSPELPELPGVLVAPTVGGQQERDPWFQTNETVRRFVSRTHAEPRFLFAPARPTPQLWRSLQEDPQIREITDLWSSARVMIAGIGAPYLQRETMTSAIPPRDDRLREAVGDICLHFFSREGEPIEFPGSASIVRPPIAALRDIPVSIALAAGEGKADAIRGAVRASLVNTLIMDAPTAEALLATE